MKICSKVFVFVLVFPSALFAFDLEGKVRLDPPFPEPHSLEIPKGHAASCGPRKLSPKLKVSPEGFVANAVVKIESENLTRKFSPPGQRVLRERLSSSPPYVLDQKGCEFSPHVLLVPAGEVIAILNSDGFLHNVRAFNESAEMLFNVAMPKKGQVLKKRFDEPGRIVLRCGLHHWMHALVVVKDHPYYAITDELGYFKISGIPDGTYRLSVWHEELGEMRSEVDSKTRFLNPAYPAKR